MKAGFTGGLVVDYPNSTKAKKMFLVLFTGGTDNKLPKGLSEEHKSTVAFNNNRHTRVQTITVRATKKSKAWIIAKKERRRRQGKEVRDDSKYTGRKRNGHF